MVLIKVLQVQLESAMNDEALIDLGTVSEETLGLPIGLYIEGGLPFECQNSVVTIPGCS